MPFLRISNKVPLAANTHLFHLSMLTLTKRHGQTKNGHAKTELQHQMKIR